MKKINVALFCRKNNFLNNYLSQLNNLESLVNVVHSISDLKIALKEKQYNGILVDVSSLMREPKNDRLHFQKLIDIFPVVQLNWNRIDKKCGALFYGKEKNIENIDEFISKACRTFKPRTVRSNDRRNTNLNSLICKSNGFSNDDVERTITINISQTGCFMFSVQNWELNENVWIIFKELKIKTHISGKIVRINKWGRNMSFPGIGIHFTEIKHEQRLEIVKL